MKPRERLEMLKEDRIQRIMQKSGLQFPGPPPEGFVNAVRECAEAWKKNRAARHVPSGLIYHYCDAPALLNILRSRTVWATGTKYLNDTTELFALSGSMRSHANNYRSTAAGEALSDMVDFYWISSDVSQTQTIGMNRFACCFSTDGDLLSQWRSYGNNGRGYAIGFDPGDIAGLSEQKPAMSLRRITYGGGPEAQLIDDLFQRFVRAIGDYTDILDNSGWDNVPARNWLSLQFGECLLELAEEVKDSAFSEESEWRLYGSQQKIQFRVSQDRIVPYQELDLSSQVEPGLLPIGEIIVGPRLDFDEAFASLITYSSTLGYGTAMNIRKSKAPYR